MKRLLILGCTGSIGTTTLDALRANPGLCEVAGLSCNSNFSVLPALAKEFGCDCVASPAATDAFRFQAQKAGLRVFTDVGELIRGSGADLVLNGISGAAGLTATYTALNQGIDVALANKESMVMAGEILNNLAAQRGCRIIPVDSEHSAIYELVKAFGFESIDKLIITASGGPFRNLSRSELKGITVERACGHPTWKMGRKISIDSATMANKGLEIIEAGRLFNVTSQRIQAVIHPQSCVHSMVSLKNGQTYAQMSQPTMTFPILNAIFDGFGMEADRQFSPALFDVLSEVTLEFRRIDTERFPLVRCAYDCLNNGSWYPIVFNAADEIAVQAFVDGRIGFEEIDTSVVRILERASFTGTPETVEDVLMYDSLARELSRSVIC